MKKKLLALVLALTFAVPTSLMSSVTAAALTLTVRVQDSATTYSVEVGEDFEFVKEIKLALETQTNINAYQQMLYYNGNALDNYDTIASLGLSDGAEFTLGKLYDITGEYATAYAPNNEGEYVEIDKAPAGLDIQIHSDDGEGVPDGKYLTCDYLVNDDPIGEPGSGENIFTMPECDVFIKNPLADQREVKVNLTTGEATMTRMDYITLTDAGISNNPRRYDEGGNEYFDFDGDGVYDTVNTENNESGDFKITRIQTISTLADEYTCDLADKHYEIGKYKFILKNVKQAQTITFEGFEDNEASKTYGDAPFSIGAKSQGGALSYAADNSGVVSVDNSGTVTVHKAGTGNIYVTAEQTDDYFEGSATFTVYFDQKEVALEWGSTKLVYNGDEQAPTVTARGLAENETLTVGIKQKGTAVGEYRAEAVISNKNYKLPNEHSCLYTIEPKPVTVSWSNLEFTYNGTDTFSPKAQAQGVCSGDDCSVTVEGEGKNAGNYTARAVRLDNENYKLGGEYTTEFKVLQKEVTLNWDQTSFIADGNTEFCPQATATGLCGGDKCTVTVTGGSKKNGKHTATATALSNPNYKLPAKNTVDYTVLHSGENALIVSIENWNYGEKAKAPTAVYALDANREITFEYKPKDAPDSQYSPSVPTQAGSYTLRASVAAWELAQASSAQCNFTINKVDAAYTAPTCLTLTYNGEAQQLVAPGVSNDGTFEYSLNGENWSRNIPTATDAGNYTVYWALAGDNNHIGTARGENELSSRIKKADPVFTAPQPIVGLTYTGEPQQLIKETPSNDGTFRYRIEREKWGNTIPTKTEGGTYDVSWLFDGDKNHNSTTKDETITVKIGAVEPVFDEPVPNPGLFYTGKWQVLALVLLPENGSFEFSLDGKNYSENVPLAKDAGTYTVYWKFIPKNESFYGKSGKFNNVISRTGGKDTIALKQDELVLTYFNPPQFSFDLQNIIISSVGEVTFTLYNAEGVTLKGTVLTFPKDFEGMIGVIVHAKGDKNHFGYIGMIKIYLDHLTDKEILDRLGEELQDLPPGVFDYLPRLNTLDLSDGHLENLDPQIFLEYPALVNSPMMQMMVNNTAFEGLTIDDPFTVSPDSFGDHPANMFDNINLLKTLDLSDGEIEDLDPKYFDDVNLQNMNFLEFDPGWVFNDPDFGGTMFTPLMMTCKNKQTKDDTTLLIDNETQLTLKCLSYSSIQNSKNSNTGGGSGRSGGGGGGSSGGEGGGGSNGGSSGGSKIESESFTFHETDNSEVSLRLDGNSIEVSRKDELGNVSLLDNAGGVVIDMQLEAEVTPGEVYTASEMNFGVGFSINMTEDIPDKATIACFREHEGVIEQMPFDRIGDSAVPYEEEKPRIGTKVSLKLREDLMESPGNSKSRTYKITHMHKGKIDLLERLLNNISLVFYSDKFSKFYFVWYVNETPDEPIPETKDEPSSDTETDTASDTPSDTDSGTSSDTDNTTTHDTHKPIGALGDVDGDGDITANDALTILRASIGLAKLSPDETKLADADGDGSITANDALAVLRYSVGIIDEDSPIKKPVMT